MTTDTGLAIKSALKLLGRSNTVDTSEAGSMPTAKTRAVLDFLTASTQEELKNQELNLREMTQSLFDWHEEKRSTKALLHAFNNAIMTEGKYAEAVEITGFISALAPLMQPDRLARLFEAINEVETAYAPARYTVSLYQKLNWLLARYPEERRETLARSLWVVAHKGRWWDITTGVQDEEPAQQQEEEGLQLADLIKDFSTDLALHWTEQRQALFSTASEKKYGSVIRDAIERYSDNQLDEKIVDPDFAVFAGGIKWLAPRERPESPVASLVSVVQQLPEVIDEYEFPEKPKRFNDLFPNIRLYGEQAIARAFPIIREALTLDGQTLNGVQFEVVRNAVELEANKTFMGNCTWSYKGQMEKGMYILFRMHYQGEIYNAATAFNQRNNGDGSWGIREVNSRFNRGAVPQKVRDLFSDLVKQLPGYCLRNNEDAQREVKRKLKVSYKL